MNPEFSARTRAGLQVLFVGNRQHAEFRDVIRWLGDWADVKYAQDVTAARQVFASQEAVRLIVVAQSRPGEFRAADIEQLHASAPLARLVSLLGGLCEGEARSGSPWPGVPRIYWHQWQARCESELLPLLEEQRSGWTLPR